MRSLTVLILGAFVLISGMPAQATQLDERSCQQMAIWARDVIWARDMGADRDKVRKYIDEQRKEHDMFIVLAPMFNHLWETTADRTDIMQLVYRDCLARRGVYGTDT